MQNRAVQGMLDFDYVCSRKECSVAAIVYPFTGDHKQKFYWGHKEILIPGKYLLAIVVIINVIVQFKFQNFKS